nr:hypothetical protein [Ignavibacteriaceae bacterium]
LGIKKYDRKAHFVNQDKMISEVKIKLNNHFGENGVPCVKVGDTVSKGQLIGKVNEEALGTPFHSSIDGQVKEIVNNSVIISSNIS